MCVTSQVSLEILLRIRKCALGVSRQVYCEPKFKFGGIKCLLFVRIVVKQQTSVSNCTVFTIQMSCI